MAVDRTSKLWSLPESIGRNEARGDGKETCRLPDRDTRAELGELLIAIKQRGLEIAPNVAVGRGRPAPGDRGGHSRYQSPALLGSQNGNVLNKVALSVQVKMNRPPFADLCSRSSD